MAREERHQLGQRAVEIAGKHRRHDAAGILLAADQRKIAVALALGRMADEALVLQNLEKRGDGGVLGVGFVGPGDDVVDHRVAQTPENLHDLLLAASQFRNLGIHRSCCFGFTTQYYY